MIVFFNGNYVKEEDLLISPLDHGFLYGVGAFETLRTYRGEPFLLKRHLERIRKALAQLKIQIDLSESDLREVLKQLLESNHLEEGYFRLHVSAGVSPIGLPKGPYVNPNFIIFVKPLVKQGEDLNEKRAQILGLRRNTPEGENRIKSPHYLNNILGSYELENTAEIEGIFLTDNQEVAEGIVSNVFWVKNGVVYTPSLDTGILEGVTRNFVIELIREGNLTLKVGRYTASDLKIADEIFITNSILGICRISHLDNGELPSDSPLTKWLWTIYKKSLY